MEIRALLSALWRSRTGPVLVAAQVAITLAVVVNVAYIVQQRLSDTNKPTGIDLDNMFWVGIDTLDTSYNQAAAVPVDLTYLNSLPGVVSATLMGGPLPQSWGRMGLPFAADPKQLETPNGGVPGAIYMGTEKFLDTFGLKLVAGRDFDPNVITPPSSDMAGTIAAWAPEMIVTRAMANKLFPKGDALGKTVYVGLTNKTSTIVGIVEHMQAGPSPPRFEQFAIQIVIVPVIGPGPGGTYVVRTRPGERDRVMAKVEKEFADLQPGRYVRRMEAYEVTAASIRAGTRSSAVILATVAFFVLAVTVVGIVGLAAFNVTTRTKQLGTRRAIGARKFHILRYFLVENWIITSGGALLGCVLALAAGIKLSTMYQTPRLPLYYLVGGVVLVWIVGVLSVAVPARRAARISPAIATRSV
jgi:putative ABC transport system permease protein